MAKFLDLNGLTELWAKISQAFQRKISVSGILKGDGNGGVSSADTVEATTVDIESGLDGVTFTPAVSEDGVLSWANDGGKENPASVNIKGATGAPGTNGVDGAPGKDGTDGKNGTTFTPAVSSDGVLSWTNDGGKSNPENVNIKGPQGETGPNSVTTSTTSNISGLLKGSGGKVAQAVANSDYISPANMKTFLNRQTALNAANTNYTTLMARGESLNASETTPAVNGAIAWQYE